MPFLKTVRKRFRVLRLTALLLIASACFLSGRVSAADSVVALEYKVKGGYLYNIAKFVEWPTNTFIDADSPLVIGVIDGGGEGVAVLQALLEGKKVDGHPVQLKAVTADKVGQDIQILFVTRTARISPEEIRTALGGAATLLVGETDQFAERGGMVGFTREADNIRLSLNLELATEAGLKVSSTIARVAKLVKTKRNK